MTGNSPASNGVKINSVFGGGGATEDLFVQVLRNHDDVSASTVTTSVWCFPDSNTFVAVTEATNEEEDMT